MTTDVRTVGDLIAFTTNKKQEAEAYCADTLSWVSSVESGSLAAACTPGYSMTVAFVDDLATVLMKLDYGPMKTLFGHLISEELGCDVEGGPPGGDPRQGHAELYKQFLISLGGDGEEDPWSCSAANAIQMRLASESVGFGIGARGMGGECLCQVYLTEFCKQLLRNPAMKEHHDVIDHRFMEIHTGPADREHAEMFMEQLTGWAAANPDLIPDIVRGYEHGNAGLAAAYARAKFLATGRA
jgi:hypothetical protein